MSADVQPSPCTVGPEKNTAPPQTLNDFCRICLLRKRSLIPLTSELNGTMIPEMLWKVSGTMLNVLEQLPRVICDHCLTKLDLAYNISQEFRKQEEVLRSFCWKGALIDQLDGFQQTEDAVKVPYSDEVLRKLTSASQTAAVLTVEEDKPNKESEQPEKESTDKGDSEFSGEQLDDIIEVVGDVIEEDVQSTEDFEMIVEESSEGAESPTNVKKEVLLDFSQNDESQNSITSIKKEAELEEKKTDSETLEVSSLTITKLEDEEWIEEDEKLSEQVPEESESEELAIASCIETDDSQDPIWFDEEESHDDDGADQNSNDREPIQEESPTRKRRKKGLSLIRKDRTETPKRPIKSELNAEGLYHCKVCDRTFSVQKTFLNHLRSHEHVLQGSYKCQQCDKAFGTKNRLKRHEEIHTRDLSCRECDKKFANVHELRGHQHVHLKGKWKCSSCDFVCYSRDQMKQHRETSECAKLVTKPPPKPARLKDPKCPYEGCDYRATKYGAMYVHKRTKHQSTYECDMCDKKFAFVNQLKQHETIHTGEKPYQCEICDKPFRRLFSFKEHMAIHEGEQKYVCNLCGKSFARPRYLAAHVVTHSTKRPFECTMCDANYKTKGELTKHVRAKHETLEYGNGNDLIEEDYDYFEDEIYL